MKSDSGSGVKRSGAVRRATGPRYGRASAPRRASQTGDPLYRRVSPRAPMPRARKNAVHSVVSALPPLMLVIGLAVYYLGERAQTGGAPIAAESRHYSGRHAGVSAVNSGGEGQHYLWFEADGERRNVRIRPDDVATLRAALDPGDPIVFDAAPTVAASPVRWVWRLHSGERAIVDRQATLR